MPTVKSFRAGLTHPAAGFDLVGPGAEIQVHAIEAAGAAEPETSSLVPHTCTPPQPAPAWLHRCAPAETKFWHLEV